MSSLFQVSERCHAGLILLSVLAAEYRDETRWCSLQDVAREKHVSHGYLEEIASLLKQAELIQGRKGPGGGYRLTRVPAEITTEQILVAIEGPIQLVGCQQSPGVCPSESACGSKALWGLLQRRITETLHQVTLEDILNQTL